MRDPAKCVMILFAIAMITFVVSNGAVMCVEHGIKCVLLSLGGKFLNYFSRWLPHAITQVFIFFCFAFKFYFEPVYQIALSVCLSPGNGIIEPADYGWCSG